MKSSDEFEAWWNLVRGYDSAAPAKEIARAAAEWADRHATERAAKIVCRLASECNLNDEDEVFGFNRLKRAEYQIRGKLS